MSMKLSEEQLSAVLSAHEGGRGYCDTSVGLQRGGLPGYPCLFQVAVELPPSTDVLYVDDDAHVEWFDRNYDRRWSADEFLRALEARGLA